MGLNIIDMSGRKALVIGGGLGMGESTATFLARAGCDVAVLDLVEERALHVASIVSSLGRRGFALSGDILDAAQVDPLIRQAEQRLGGLDVMVSIVGQAGWAPVLEMTLDQWMTDQHRNLGYFFLAAQAVARSMVVRSVSGSIIAIASVSGIQSAPRHAAYGAAKAGLINLVKSMAVELAASRIRVNAIAPGTILTPRTEQNPNREAYAELIAASSLPFAESGVPDDIANAALFFASDMSRYVTGQTLAVDGGWTAATLLGPPA